METVKTRMKEKPASFKMKMKSKEMPRRKIIELGIEIKAEILIKTGKSNI